MSEQNVFPSLVHVFATLSSIKCCCYSKQMKCVMTAKLFLGFVQDGETGTRNYEGHGRTPHCSTLCTQGRL